MNSAGQIVPGELTITPHPTGTRAIHVFHPAEPWTLGEAYSVTDLATAPGPRSSTGSTFTVAPALTLDAGLIASEPAPGEQRTMLDDICCEDVDGDHHCRTIDSQTDVSLSMFVALPEEHHQQWLSRLRPADESTRSAVAEPVSPWGHPRLQVVEGRLYYCVQRCDGGLPSEDACARYAEHCAAEPDANLSEADANVLESDEGCTLHSGHTPHTHGPLARNRHLERVRSDPSRASRSAIAP